MGVSFAYVASMQAIAADYSIGAIFGAQIVGGIVAAIIGFFIDKIRKVFPPLVTGTVVFTIGLSLYSTAVNYMAGGASSDNYGHWKNWLVALITLAVVTILNHYAKGFVKLASILIGIIVGYIVAACFGMVDLSAVASASFFQAPQIMHFGIEFEPSSCIAIALLFAINAIQAIGDFTATTTGSMDREPTDKELKGAIVGYGCTNVIGAFLGGLPTASYSQNVGIVTTTKVINRMVLGLAALILLVAGLVPKFSGLLTTIPQSVLGGATISVFASIAMTGIRLITSEEMNYRNTSIVGLAVALGVGVTQASASLGMFPGWVTTVFGKSPVVISTIVAVFLNLVLPKAKPQESK
jgi:NCS2 family nucleobase:cation symporter-2